MHTFKPVMSDVCAYLQSVPLDILWLRRLLSSAPFVPFAEFALMRVTQQANIRLHHQSVDPEEAAKPGNVLLLATL